jgi:hypothetical protein
MDTEPGQNGGASDAPTSASTWEQAPPAPRMTPMSLEVPDVGDLSNVPPRASRTLAALVRLHRVTGRRKVRVVLDPETVADLEPYCTTSPAGRPALGGWELVAAPDQSADQVTLFDAEGGWVLGTFTPQFDVAEAGGRVYEGLRRSGYAIPEALDLASELGPPMVPTELGTGAGGHSPLDAVNPAYVAYQQAPEPQPYQGPVTPAVEAPREDAE